MSPDIRYFVEERGVNPQRSMKGVLTPEGALELNNGIKCDLFKGGEEVDIKLFPDGSFMYVTKPGERLFASVSNDQNLFAVVYNPPESK
jgi:hypothetical protein